MFWWAIYYIWTVEILHFRQIFPILPISSIGGHETNNLLWKGGRFDTTAIPEGGRAEGRTIRCSSRGEKYAPLLYSTATDPGNGISPSPGSICGSSRTHIGPRNWRCKRGPTLHCSTQVLPRFSCDGQNLQACPDIAWEGERAVAAGPGSAGLSAGRMTQSTRGPTHIIFYTQYAIVGAEGPALDTETVEIMSQVF